MKSLALLVLAFVLPIVPARAAGKKFVLYATLIESMPVKLDDGAQWMMDKGDAFPVLMFKEQQTKVILQLAGTRFIIPTNRVRILEEKDVTPEMLAAYRRNVDSYLEGQAKKWKEESKSKPQS